MLSDMAIVARLRERAHARRIARLTPETALRLAAALYAVVGADRARPRPARPAGGEDLDFAVEIWTRDGQRVARVLARAANALVARGAWKAACEQYPDDIVMLRHGAWVLERNIEVGPEVRHAASRTDGKLSG